MAEIGCLNEHKYNHIDVQNKSIFSGEKITVHEEIHIDSSEVTDDGDVISNSSITGPLNKGVGPDNITSTAIIQPGGTIIKELIFFPNLDIRCGQSGATDSLVFTVGDGPNKSQPDNIIAAGTILFIRDTLDGKDIWKQYTPLSVIRTGMGVVALSFAQSELKNGPPLAVGAVGPDVAGRGGFYTAARRELYFNFKPTSNDLAQGEGGRIKVIATFQIM